MYAPLIHWVRGELELPKKNGKKKTVGLYNEARLSEIKEKGPKICWKLHMQPLIYNTSVLLRPGTGQ